MSASDRDKVLACWLGKAIGGTLGMPWEGFDGPNDLEFYSPMPSGMVSNDDLDFQVLWACVLDEMGDDVRVDRHVFVQAWDERVAFPWAEYGVCKRNIANGLKPPMTGSFDNWWTEGMGAAIRSELWACLAPGDPDRAAAYAYEDACVDHAGDGIWAEQFLARLESAAFVETDLSTVLDIAVAGLPEESRVLQAVNDTRRWWAESDHDGQGDWRVVRQSILDAYYVPDFSHVVMNMGFTVLGLLAGRGDFGRSICIATNCGQDTDCTAATVGSVLGIMNPACIDERWLAPIGMDLVVDARIKNITPPKTLEGFTDLVLTLRERLRGSEMPKPVTIKQSTADLGVCTQVGFYSNRGIPIFINTNWMPITAGDASPPSAPENTVDRVWPGQWNVMSASDFADDLMWMRVPFALPGKQAVRVCFGSTADTRLWLDGKYVFGREAGGRMLPSPHLAPINTWCDVVLDAGEHELVVVLRRPRDVGNQAGEVEWCLDLGDGETMQWLVGVLERA